MSVYTDKTEITDITIRNVKQDATEWAAWLETYLLRADDWYLERCEELGVVEADVLTYAQGQKFTVKDLLRYWVYITVLTELRANGIIDNDDYNSKLYNSNGTGYKNLFDKANDKLTANLITGLPAEINRNTRTGRRVMLYDDYEGETINE